MQKIIPLVVSILFLAACQNTHAPTKMPIPHFTHKPALSLQVRDISVTEDYEFPSKSPYIEHTLDYPPSEMFTIWLKDRLKADGASSYIQASITDASIQKTELPKTPGIKGLFTNDQTEKYDAKMVVQLRLYNEERTIAIADVNATSTRSITIAENASVVERDTAYYNLSKALVNDIGNELEKQIRRVFAAYILK
jgi:hypothetical protein